MASFPKPGNLQTTLRQAFRSPETSKQPFGKLSGDRETFKQAPYIINGITLFPARIIAETFGAAYDWVPETCEIILSCLDIKIAMQIDSLDAYVNGIKQTLPCQPQIKNGTPMVPIRFVAEAFGAVVEYDADNKRDLVLKGR